MSQHDFKTRETMQPQEARPVKHHRKRNKKVVIKHGFEGTWERVLLWNG
jgi:hypothetical protein